VELAETVTMSDGTSAQYTLHAEIADGLELTDVVETIAQIAVSLSDGVTLRDTTIDTSVLPSGIVSMTITSRRGTITVASRQPTITIGG
jgi:hypothetical protein